MTRHVVIGGGSWGSAIASSLQRAQQPVTVLARNQQTADMLARGTAKNCLIVRRLRRLMRQQMIIALRPPR